MALVSVTKIFEERLQSDSDHTEYVESYRVEYETAGEASIVDAAEADDGTTAIPLYNVVISGSYRLKSKNADRDSENPNFFTVNCTISDAQDESQSGGSGGEKLNVDLKVQPETYEEPVYLDRNKKKICNTAGQVFSNQPTKRYYDKRYIITFQTGLLDQANMELCEGCINKSAVTIHTRGYTKTFPKGTLLFEAPSFGTKVSAGSFVWDVAYNLLYRKDGWKRKILNVGRGHIMPNGKLGWVAWGPVLASEDTPLDKDGKAILTPAAGPAKLDTVAAAGEPCYSEFDIENEAEFAGLLAGL